MIYFIQMTKGNNLSSKPPLPKEESPTPFYIIRDYRKTIKLKKQRQLRKKRLLEQKELIKDV